MQCFFNPERSVVSFQKTFVHRKVSNMSLDNLKPEQEQEHTEACSLYTAHGGVVCVCLDGFGGCCTT